MDEVSALSEYAKYLGAADGERYRQKLTYTRGDLSMKLPDPYTIKQGWVADPAQLPPTDYKCIYNYLIKTPGPFTGEALESYKSLDAYNYFVCGYVQEVRQHNVESNSPVVFVKAVVTPGQRVTETPHEPWVCLDKVAGYVVASHCSCMAGLGEACSHIAALLFSVEAVNYCAINDHPAATSVRCIWNNYYKKKVLIGIAWIHCIRFGSPKFRKFP